MTHLLRIFGYGVSLAATFALILFTGGAANAQQDPAPEQLLSPEQLDDLVAPIALYPDPLISQVLVASTYPLEIVEASQWLQRNPNVSGTALTQAAVKQDWDPSIQALVVFPDVLKYLMEDIAWTTNLGNAFLVQEGDVMDAIQRMRDRAARLGKLQTTPEQQVIRVVEAGQPVYEIIPTNPTVIYVPVYDPYYIWGSALYYPYPRWYYPAYANHVYFSRGIYIDAYYGSGWYGSISYGPTYRVWNSWGWRPAWNNRTVVVNNVFIDNHYYNASRPRIVSGTTTAWSHDASHRRGVVYPNTVSYDRYRRDPRDNPRPQLAQGQNRSGPAQVATRSTGSTNTARVGSSRTDGRSDGRTDNRLDGRQDSRQDARPDTRPDTRTDSRQVTRQDSRQDARPDTRQEPRVVGRDSSPSASSRNSRVDSTSRNDRGNSNVNTSRTASVPAQVASSLPTHVTPAQVTLERQRGPAQGQPNSRESRPAQDRVTSTTRQSAGPSREAPSARTAAPSVSQMSNPRQSSTSRTAAPEMRSSPAQQVSRSSVSQGSQGVQRSQPSQIAQASPRQSAPDRGVSSESRRAPSSQAAPSSSGQSGRSSNAGGNGGSNNGGGNGGGNSKGRR
jgi:hypothetical protein